MPSAYIDCDMSCYRNGCQLTQAKSTLKTAQQVLNTVNKEKEGTPITMPVESLWCEDESASTSDAPGHPFPSKHGYVQISIQQFGKDFNEVAQEKRTLCVAHARKVGFLLSDPNTETDRKVIEK